MIIGDGKIVGISQTQIHLLFYQMVVLVIKHLEHANPKDIRAMKHGGTVAVLMPGSTFFLPNGMPYKYTAGPAGVELLEFRAGGGAKDAPSLSLDELSLDALDKLIEGYETNRDKWRQPEKIGDVAFQQRELDFS